MTIQTSNAILVCYNLHATSPACVSSKFMEKEVAMALDISAIYAEHSKFVYNIALRMLYDRDDAQDITQEVFIKLQDKLATFNGDSALRTFIYRMTVNSSIDLIRHRQSQSGRAEKSMEGKSGHVTHAYDNTMLLDSLLETLPPDHRAALLLFEIGGFPQKEIAVMLNTNAGTVKSRISRSISKMSELLKKEA